MAKTKKATPVSDDRTGSFPVPFTLDAFRKDVVEVFFHYVRTIGWMTDEKTAWAITGVPAPNEAHAFFSPEYTAADLGLTFDSIRNTPFASTLERLYEFAYFGRIDSSAEQMEYESIHTWMAAIVCDADNGLVTNEWDSYGLNIQASTRNCSMVIELANARNVLEGGESFFYYFGPPQARSEHSHDSLTIRQMALLSGMEEMSIRAAANPKRANPLQTHSADGGTRVAIDVAKAWLLAKGRYVQIQPYRSAGEVDLAKRGFVDTWQILDVLDARYQMLVDHDGLEVIKARLQKLGVSLGNGLNGTYMGLEEEAFANESFMRSLAEVLALPVDLFVLRCKEVLAKRQLARVERELRELADSRMSSSENAQGEDHGTE